MAITRLSGGTSPANGSDPRTFPAIWNNAVDDIEAAESAISTLQSDLTNLEIDDLGDVTITTPADGEVLTYDDGTSEWVNQALPASGKILQIVRATDTTNRATGSTSFVDADISVSITPTSASSNIIVLWSNRATMSSAGGQSQFFLQITDSSNVALSGAEEARFVTSTFTGSVEQSKQPTLIGYVSAGDTSARTYKGRMRIGTGTGFVIQNASNTGQLFAIEVAS